MSTRTFRLGAKTRKGFLVAHIASAGSWMGIEVALGVLVLTAVLTSDPQVVAVCYRAAETFVWPMLTSGLICLVSGVVLGLGTKYGLLRYWWVALKLALNLVLCMLILILLRPGLRDAAATVVVSTNLFFPPIVSGVSLVFAMVLSVYKPWGRTR